MTEEITPPIETPTPDPAKPDADTAIPPAGDPPADEFDENDIDPEVRDYKPAVPVEEEDNTDPEDRARIQKIVDKTVGGTVQQLQRQLAVDQFFNGKPEFAKYKGAAEKYLNHPTYAGLPIQNIVAIVASKDMQKIGAQKEREAQRIVSETQNPGTTVRKPAGGTTDWHSASKDDFEAQKAKVLGRQGV